MTKALIIVEAGFQDEELVYPLYRMQEEGWEVDIASPDGRVRHGKYGVPARANKTIADCVPADYAALVIPGGFECPDRLRERADVKTLVLAMWGLGRVVAAICHGPWVLVSAGLARGAAMTGYESIRADIENAGATYIQSPAVVWFKDDTQKQVLITSPHYRHNGDFMKAVITAVEGWQPKWGPELCGAAAANL